MNCWRTSFSSVTPKLSGVFCSGSSSKSLCYITKLRTHQMVYIVALGLHYNYVSNSWSLDYSLPRTCQYVSVVVFKAVFGATSSGAQNQDYLVICKAKQNWEHQYEVPFSFGEVEAKFYTGLKGRGTRSCWKYY